MNRLSSSRAPAGFTLLEIAVALVIGGIAVIGASGLFIGLAGRDEAIRASAARTDRDNNGEQLLRDLLGNLELSGDTTASLTGDSLQVSFRAGCRTLDDELGHCAASLYFERQGAMMSLKLILTPGGRDSAPARAVELRRGASGLLRYLIDPGGSGRWARSWSLRQPPVAVSVIVGGDTLLLPVWGNE